jgi:hypothetical protein
MLGCCGSDKGKDLIHSNTFKKKAPTFPGWFGTWLDYDRRLGIETPTDELIFFR